MYSFCMRIWAHLVLFSKLFAFSCVVFMSSANAAILPCHEVTTEIEKPSCKACLLSLEALSEPLTESVYKIVLEDSPKIIGDYSFVSFVENKDSLREVLRPPPQDWPLWRGEEIFQTKIRLRL